MLLIRPLMLFRLWLICLCLAVAFYAASLTAAQDGLPAGDSTNADTVKEKNVRDAWPRLLGSDFDGIVASKRPLDWKSHPTLLWSLPVGDGYGIGSVDRDGNYFHFDAPGGTVERLRCIDMDTGKVRWSVDQELNYRDMLQYESGPRSSPTIDNNRVFTMGVTGRLNCRSTSDGKLIWSADTNAKYHVVQNFFGVGGSPLVLDNQVIVMVGGSPIADQQIAPGRLGRVSPAGSALVAFDRNDGHQLWKCGDDLASYSSPRTMTVDGETLVLLFAREYLMAIDPKLGNVRWKVRHRADILESVNAMVPIVHGDQVFVSECYDVGSLLLKTTGHSADVVWKDPPGNRRKQAMRVHWSNPVLIDGHLYGCSGRNAADSDFRCIEFATGEVKWNDPRRTRSSVTAVGDHLLVFEERGPLQVLKANPNEMEVVAEWNFQTPDGDWPKLNYPCWASPIVVGDLLLLRGDKQVLCLKLKK